MKRSLKPSQCAYFGPALTIDSGYFPPCWGQVTPTKYGTILRGCGSALCSRHHAWFTRHFEKGHR